MQDLRINEQRLWDTLMEMGDIGGTEKGGCNRLAGNRLRQASPRPFCFLV